MRMEKRKFRIGELAEHLAVERFVIRFWEKEFDLKPARSTGGQRFYNEDDARIFGAIKELLYNRGFTIAGARKELHPIKGARSLPNPVVPPKQTAAQEIRSTRIDRTMLKQLKDELISLRTFIEKL